MENNIFALKGMIVHTPSPEEFSFLENGYLVCEKGKVNGLYENLPEKFLGIEIKDYSGRVIIPGMSDMHIHASQYGFRGMGMYIDCDATWNTWFETYSFPEESRYSDLDYADNAYDVFCRDILHSTTTRMCAYATIHREATELLMKKIDNAGLVAYIGKLNMDRNSIEGLIETTEESISETRLWLENTTDLYELVKPMITPRYIPSCTDSCMEKLEQLKNEFNVPVQSHLSESYEEIHWVKELKPEITFYGEAYDMYGMFGDDTPSVMAHCIFPMNGEFEMMKRRKNLWVAHCPQSNLHSCGSAAPIRRYLDAGINVGIGSDVAGANTLNLLRAIADCSIASRVYWATHERKEKAFAKKTFLSLSEAFYIATKGGGSFWGDVGSFEEGYEFDAVVINDNALHDLNERIPYQRLERIISRSDERHIEAKFVAGRQVL